MSRNGAGLYTLDPRYLVSEGDTILPSQHNPVLEDLQTDANTPRPIVAGGTGASTATTARTNLSVYSIADVDDGFTSKVATRTALKALDTATVKAVVLTEATRQKLFMWTTGDFTDETAADTTELNYIPADGVAVSLGCWVAVTGKGASIVPITEGGTGESTASEGLAALGGMATATYDPTSVAGDVFDMANMVEATDAKVMTAAERADLAKATLNDNTDVSANSWVLDEDDMASDSATKVPTQQSVKAKIDNDTILKVADRTALKAVDTGAHTVVFARSVGMNAKWDATVPVATHQADTAENIYVAPDPAAVGAWVFQDGQAVSLAFPAYNRPLWAKLGDFFTAKDAGLKGDGVDDTDPMDALLAYCGANTCEVVFTGGRYRITSPLSVSLSGNHSLSWRGQGSGNSIIEMDTGGDGVSVTLPGNYWIDAAPGRTGLELRDITFTTTNEDVGTGLSVTGAAVQGRPGPKILMDNVEFRAKNTFNQFWSTGLSILDAGMVHLVNSRVIIGGPLKTVGRGVYIDGTAQANSPTIMHFDKIWCGYGGTQIEIGDYIEGVYLTQPTLVNGQTNFKWHPAIGESGLHMVGGHVNTFGVGIDLDNLFDFEIAGALFYRSSTNADSKCISIGNGSRFSIVGNVFKGANLADGETAIHVVSTINDSKYQGVIDANTFNSFGSRAIWLSAASHYVKVGSANTFGQCATRVLDQGADNRVERQSHQINGVVTLTGGAASETLTVALPTDLFKAQPTGGSAQFHNADLLLQYDYTNSTTTTAQFIARSRAGTNITGAPYRFSAWLFE